MRFRPYFLFKRGFKGQPPPPIAEQVRDWWTKSICRQPLTKDDFMNVLQSPFQKEMALNGVCIDARHGTTGYDFLLTSVVVIDEYGEGFPVFMHMCVFFGELWDTYTKMADV